METELGAIKRLMQNPARPSTYILGGAKVEDKVPVIENILATKGADYVLVGGNVAKIFLKASEQKLGESDERELGDVTDEVLKANQILSKYRKRIVLPSDFGMENDGSREEVELKALSRGGRALDIGPKTAAEFSEIIERSKTIVASGPMGVFEQDGFETGTKVILETMAKSKAFTVIGGGHLAGEFHLLLPSRWPQLYSTEWNQKSFPYACGEAARDRDE
jgi:phosphoglycerate kinase